MIKGVLVPNITIFDTKGEIDKAKTQKHMRWMFENGVDGFFLTGSYGAGPLMTIEERVEVFNLAKEVAKDFPGKSLIAHVGTADTASAVKLAIEAEKAGIHAIGAVPPFYYKYNEAEVVGYYEEIVKAVKIPVYAYNNPTTTRFAFTEKTVEKLQKVGVAGLKDSSLDMKFLSQVYYNVKNTKKDFQVIIGTEVGCLPMYLMGIDTIIGGMCNYVPELVSEMYRLVKEGPAEKAEKVYEAMMDFRKIMSVADSTVVSHMALYARGFDAGYPRRPMTLPDFNDPKYEFMKNEINKALDILKM
ncbi:MAG: dihydrodipicolinate synthase [Clostridia bacterium]|jgi:dihydrodipicolinate synthase/N-acetylneuraminate lyase|nr:dihydrodipicolinate synthase [Clostridia bacterium]